MGVKMPDAGDLWTPEDYAQAAQRATFKHLSPIVRDLFSRHLGRDWAETVLDQLITTNKEIRDRPSKHPGGNTPPKLPQLVDGRLDWDFPQMVRAIREMVDKLPDLKEERSQVVTICKALGDVRNKLGHENAIVTPAESKKHVERLVSLGKLILGEDANIPRVADLLGDLVRLSSPGGEQLAELPLPKVSSLPISSTANASEMREIREMLATLLRRTEQGGAQPLSNAHPRASGAGAATSPSFDGGAVRQDTQRKRTQLPAPRPGLCLFPIVAEGDGATGVGELGYVNTNTYQPEGRQPDPSRVTGFSGAGRSDVYYQVIQDSRFGEDDTTKANLHTHARIDPGDFMGNSFGLAAALADRSARYGWAPALRDRAIIATGIVGKGARGQVEPIGSFKEKLAFLERHAPIGALVLFPAGNVAQASPEVHALLARIAAAGRVTLRPVQHLSEIGDLFASSDKPKGQATPEAISSAEISDPVQPIAGAKEHEHAKPSVPPQTRELKPETEPERPRSQPRRLTRLLLSTGLAGVTLLASAYLIAERSESVRPSPEQMQRISDFLGTYKGMDSASPTAAQCQTLTSARKALTADDQTKLEADGARAIAAAQTCAQWLSESQHRITRLTAATKLLETGGPTPASCSAWDIAVASLQPFDRDMPETGMALRTSYGEPCKTVLAESDRRIRLAYRLVDVVTRNSGDLVACRDLALAFEQLTNEDMERVSAHDGAIRARALECSAKIADSEARLRAVRDAAGAFEAADPISARALLSARSRLTPADISQLSPQQSAALQSAVDRARSLVGASEARLRNFLTSYAAWQSSPTSQNAARFAQAGDQLTEADRSQQTAGDFQRAISALQQIKDAMAARAQRWSLVERLTNSAEGQSPADYWSKLDEAVGRLNASDKEAMTSEQIQLLQRAQRLLSRAKPRENEFGTISGR